MNTCDACIHRKTDLAPCRQHQANQHQAHVAKHKNKNGCKSSRFQQEAVKAVTPNS
jgi:hypothetical protein